MEWVAIIIKSDFKRNKFKLENLSENTETKSIREISTKS